MNASVPINRNIGWIICILIFCIPLFSQLGTMPMQQWDESRLAVNAAETANTGNWLVITFNYQPDLWNVKPPLYIWLAALFIKLLGINELSTRLPAALFASGTCLLLYWFCAYKLKNVFWGIVAVLVLVCAKGYVTLHGTRTGDYDAMLTFFTTFYCLHFFLYLQYFKRKNLIYFAVGLALALLTKGIAACFYLPALLLYTILSGKLLVVLKKPEIYMVVVMAFLPVTIFYLLREHAAPGYFRSVMDNELGGRYNAVIEGHSGNVDFYFNMIVKEQFPDFYLLLPIGVILGLVSKDGLIQKAILFTASLATVFLLVLSWAATKASWYDVPVFPILALLTAYFFVAAGELLSSKEVGLSLKYNVVPLAIVMFFCAKPFAEECYNSMHPLETEYFSDGINIQEFLQLYLKNKLNGKEVTLVTGDVLQSVYFYKLALDAKGIKTTFAEKEKLIPGMKVSAWEDDIKNYVERHYEVKPLLFHNTITVYQINGTK